MMFLVMAVTQLLTLGYLNFSLTFLYLPVIILIQTMFLIGVTLFLSALAVFFRDVTHLIGIVILFWFFLTPVFYTLDIVSSQVARLIRWLNPMASMVEFYREILYGNAVGIGKIPTPAIPAPDSLLRIIVTTGLVLALGYWFFQRHSGQFGEEL
jgi:lipopolysaccharide transport system permease protein